MKRAIMAMALCVACGSSDHSNQSLYDNWLYTSANGQAGVGLGELGQYARGSTVAMFPYSVHRDPRFFEDPETFRPERWSPTFEERLPAQAFFPFGAGPHRCIGATFAMMELRLILATIAARFRLTPESEEPLRLRASITARPVRPVRMRIQARH